MTVRVVGDRGRRRAPDPPGSRPPRPGFRGRAPFFELRRDLRRRESQLRGVRRRPGRSPRRDPSGRLPGLRRRLPHQARDRGSGPPAADREPRSLRPRAGRPLSGGALRQPPGPARHLGHHHRRRRPRPAGDARQPLFRRRPGPRTDGPGRRHGAIGRDHRARRTALLAGHQGSHHGRAHDPDPQQRGEPRALRGLPTRRPADGADSPCSVSSTTCRRQHARAVLEDAVRDMPGLAPHPPPIGRARRFARFRRRSTSCGTGSRTTPATSRSTRRSASASGTPSPAKGSVSRIP